MKKITTPFIFLFLSFFLGNQSFAQGSFYAQSVTVTTSSPDSCTDLIVDVMNYMGCINFSVNPTATVSVNGSTISIQVECTSSPICAGAISFPVVSANAGNISSGTYTVEADAFLDNVYVNTVSTTVTIAPCSGSSVTSILNQSNSGAVCAGNNSNLSVTAFNATSYQWQSYNAPNWMDLTNSGVYSGVNTDQLALSNLPANYDGNQYRCIAIGTSNNDTSTVETITVNPLPVVSLSPGNSAICDGESLNISASPSGSYQWYQDGVIISGATSASYSASANAAYNVILTDANSCSDSAATAINITVHALPDFSINSSNPDICLGDTVSLTAPAGGSYQWFSNGNSISGATSETHLTTIGGNFNVEYTDNNGCTNTADSSISVFVNNVPQFSLAQSDTSICGGDSLVLIGPTGGSNQWHLDGSPIAGATSDNYTAAVGGTYNVSFTDGNGCNNMASNELELTITVCASTTDLSIQNWNVYPNPVSNLIYLDQKEMALFEYRLYNLNGQLILQEDIVDPLTTINISDLPNGFYLLKLSGQTDNYSLKITKQ